MRKKVTVKFDIEIENESIEEGTILALKNMEFDEGGTNPMIVAFGTMQFLRFLTEQTPPEYLIQGERTKQLYDQIRHFATYLESEAFIAPACPPACSHQSKKPS